MALSSAPAESVQPTVATATATATVASDFERLALDHPPPLDPAWCQYEKEANLPVPRIVEPPLERQPRYVTECRELSERMRAPGTRDQHLSEGIVTRPLTASSSLDGYAIPLLEYSEPLETTEITEATEATEIEIPAPDATWVVFYIHGGGLHIGEADSEDLSCRRIVKEAKLPSLKSINGNGTNGYANGHANGHTNGHTNGHVNGHVNGYTNGHTNHAITNGTTPPLLYSVGYRLMPLYPATTCLADCVDAFRHVRTLHPHARLLLVGSSSGGELAALVAQEVHDGLHGVVLRCPVTSDAFGGLDPYVPSPLRPLHTSTTTSAFETSLLGPMRRLAPRDGLVRMPLEAPADVLRRLPPHWIQVCTNDMLYSDGVCYAKALEWAGVTARVSVFKGWPHTFWLRTPWLPQALEAERAMLDGLSWVAGA